MLTKKIVHEEEMTIAFDCGDGRGEVDYTVDALYDYDDNTLSINSVYEDNKKITDDIYNWNNVDEFKDIIIYLLTYNGEWQEMNDFPIPNEDEEEKNYH